MRPITLVLFCLVLAELVQAGASPEVRPIRPGDPHWPVAWASYRPVKGLEEDIADMLAHGVGLMERNVSRVEDARTALAIARRTGMKYHIGFGEVTENAGMVRDAGLQPVDAVLIGGVYRGRAIDRHLFAFSAARQEILIEPPVYNKGFAYTRGSGGTGAPQATEKVAHYFPDMPAPLRAEVIVPLKPFDGQQHLKIVPAAVSPAPPDARLEVDSATAEMAQVGEIRNRRLYRLSFDLSGLEDAMLDHVGIAVYWPYHGSNQYWMFGRGNVSARAESTREALRRSVRKALAVWTEANGGTFPIDVVLAGRFGDECFYITGHMNSPACSYPLWEYSQPSIEAFKAKAGDIEYPRTWGYPEIYGPDAYGWWLYNLHEGCAQLAGIVREEIANSAPGLLLFRNTTRAGVFDLNNDHDGSGQELLARNLDVIHLDPYPVSAKGYGANIPTDMSYCAGLARRYHRLLVPWMQAHTYGGPGGLTDVSPADVDRMAQEQWKQGVDTVIWLGYGHTFPKVRPDSWEHAAMFHKRLSAGLPQKPVAKLAVLRPYSAWALSSQSDDGVRNPADWMLQQFLNVWAVKNGRAYDVFELPPAMSDAERKKLDGTLKGYPYVVSTQPHHGAWVIGADTAGKTINPAREMAVVKKRIETELESRGWLKEIH